jgi:predicted AlkP superfamily phosphohydrolase/phosphomutase
MTRYAAAFLVLAAILYYAEVALRRSETGGGTPASGSSYRVMLLGFDGTDPEFLTSLMSQGKLPNFERLFREGAYGPCRTFKPTKSNVIWTSVATGKRMEKHGIVDWMVLSEDGQERLLTTGNQRRTEALWNIATAGGKSVEIVNWWATWPAESVAGEMVSNHFTKARRARIEDATYPAALYDELLPFTQMETADVEQAMRAAGIPVYSEEITRGMFRPTENFRRRFESSIDLFAEDMLVERVATHLMETRGQRDLFGVVFRNVDIFSHFLWRFIDIRLATEVFDVLNVEKKPVTPEIERTMDEAYASVLEAVYIHEDRRLGRFLQRAGPDTVVIVVSDHGFQFRNYGFYHYALGPPGARAPGSVETVAPPGVVFLWGPPVRAGARLGDASVFDVTPTALYLMGLPVGEDMDGRVLVEAISPELLAARPVEWTPTHDTGTRGGDPRESPVDEEILKELETLGYVS